MLTVAIPRAAKLSKVFLHAFKGIGSKLQRYLKRSYEFIYILGMNTNYFNVFVVPSENRTSAEPCCNWHAKDEVLFVHIDLTNILRQLF